MAMGENTDVPISSKTDQASQRTITPPPEWPENITYLSQPQLSPYLTSAQRKWLQAKPNPNPTTGAANEDSLPIIRLPLQQAESTSRVTIELIVDDKHPAYRQRGLFATRDLEPGEFIVPYLGYVHSSICSERAEYEKCRAVTHVSTTSGAGTTSTTQSTQPLDSWASSDYDLNMIRDSDRDLELAVDAQYMGNEARFTNDYRGVPAQTPTTATGADRSSDRRTKRMVKVDHGDGRRDEFAYKEEQAIPNAEFRDVWFELPSLTDRDIAHSRDNLAPVQSDDRRGTNASNIPLSGTKDRSQARIKPTKRRKNGIKGIAIFVLPADRAGKRKDGIKKGQEVLVSYGKGFWVHRGQGGASVG